MPKPLASDRQVPSFNGVMPLRFELVAIPFCLRDCLENFGGFFAKFIADVVDVVECCGSEDKFPQDGAQIAARLDV